MIQLALRSSTQAEPEAGSARSARIEGSATAVTISSSPARKTPAPSTASSTGAERRSISGARSITGSVVGAAGGACGLDLVDLDVGDPFDPVEATVVGED